MAALALRRSGLSGGLDLLNIQPEEPPPTVAPADSWSTTTLETLPEDALASVLAQLGSSVDQLVVACVSSSLCDAVSRSWARDALLLSSDPHLATDQLLLQLTLGRLARGLVRELDIAGCDLLTKSAVTRAAMAQRTIQRLNGTNVGVGSWTPEQLLRVIAALDDLRVLTADCRSLGASSPLLRLLAHPAVRLRKLVLHKPESGAALEPAADDLVSLTAALKRKPPGGGDAPVASLREVDLGQSGGGLRGAFEFVAALLAGEECRVQKLALSGVRSASVEALAALGAALDGNRHLEQLSLGCNFISAEGCRALAAAVASHPALRSLSLEHNPIQDSGAAALSAALCGRGSRLTSLSLPFTGAKDGACRALADALAAGAPLASLDLGGNLVTAGGAAALAAALADPSGCALRSLNLAANYRLGPEGALSLAAALPSSGLAELHLAGCAVGAGPVGRIAAAVARSSLRLLDLSHNQIGDRGAWDLAWAIAEPHAQLTTLILKSDDIEDDGAAELLAALAHNTVLEVLDLSGNRIDPSGEHGASQDRRVTLGFQSRPFLHTPAEAAPSGGEASGGDAASSA